jgi:hypothetical protein
MYDLFMNTGDAQMWSMGNVVPILGTLGVGGILGAFLTAWLTNRREEAKRRADFRTRQLNEFYGPLLALHKEIRARSELRVKIQNAVDQAHIEDMLDAGPDGLEEASDLHLPGILKTIEDENQTFRAILMPRYNEMVDVFRGKMWLAEPETRKHFAALIEFVDVWVKILDDRLPRTVAPAIGHTEENLHPFYSHVEATHDRLRAELN